MNDELKKMRAIQGYVYQMYTLLEEMSARCRDTTFRQAARRMLAHIREDMELM